MNIEKKHTLVDTQSGKECILILYSNKVLIENIKDSKSKATEKEFATSAEALTFFSKKEWELLKKGFVLRNKNASIGEPVLHYYVGSGYTGCLAFDTTPNGIYVYKHGWFKTAADQKDFLSLIDIEGNLIETIELPKILAWDIQYNAVKDALLLDTDHFIFEYSLATKKFNSLTKGFSKPVSFISVSSERYAFGSHPQLYVFDKDTVLLKHTFDVEIVRGHLPFEVVLSKNGQWIAFHNQENEIKVIQVSDDKVVKHITGEFGVISQMEFAENDTILVVRSYGWPWSIRYFDLVNGNELAMSELQIPSHSQQASWFCFNGDQSKLVIVQNKKAFVFDFLNKTFLYNFQIEHSVKTARPKFVNDLLGFRTDYGCFSLYQV
ncbi:hypothetical protein [Xanthocytophaga agilis]|uniref:WD40 repeat domain-containing protein n=1 Tax=Xanthocytophaga agilis TaxID=3048010 RepID=A0AAE3UGF0_9BACT|nr:hypothetical protein [Xanthocytophaga agilis]MDJ1501528.1 hypothetical protein [Xanthocytophaga agilis]